VYLTGRPETKIGELANQLNVFCSILGANDFLVVGHAFSDVKSRMAG
jgi:hypothetical protein